MNLRPHLPLLACLSGGLLLTSCYDPYYTGGMGPLPGEYPPGYVDVDVEYRPGHVVTTLPTGYRTTSYQGVRYYHHNGVWFRSRGSSYVVIDQPDFIEVEEYYERDDYRRGHDRYDRDRYADRGRRYDDGGWADHRGRRGDHDRDGIPDRYDPRPHQTDTVRVIRQLPPRYKTIHYRGRPYYRVDETYYQFDDGLYRAVPAPF